MLAVDWIQMSEDAGPKLSVVLRVVGGDVFLRRCLQHLVAPIKDKDIEVIVPYDSTVRGIEGIKGSFPGVLFLDMGVVDDGSKPYLPDVAHILYDRRTAAGLRVAKGRIVALLEDYGAPDPDWCAQILKAHEELPHSVIGGAVEHAGKNLMNWAVYFLDFGRYQLPLAEGPAEYLTDVNVSYQKAALDSVRDLWSEKYNEVTVHWALARKGFSLWRRPQIIVRQDRGRLLFSMLVIERFCWGRLFAATRTRELSFSSRLAYVMLSPILPIVLLARMTRRALAGKRNSGRFLLAFPLTAAMTLFWCAGELVGYVTGRDRALSS